MKINIEKIKTEKIIIGILLLAFLIRIITLLNYGNDLTMYSDDTRYIISGIEFAKTGHIVYDGNTEPTVFMMPGMALLLSIIFRFTGYTFEGLLLARIPFVILGVISVYGVYLIAKKLFSKNAGNIAAFLLALSFPHITINNMFLTETPFICITIFFIYFTLKYCDSKSNKDFLILLTLFLVGILFKPTIGALPLVFIPYFLIRRFPLKLIITRGIYAIVIFILFMAPWWVRNYKVVEEFLPFTGNQGDTKLLGTYQGWGYPDDYTLNDVATILNEKSRNGEYEHRYFQFKEKGEIANERIKKWKNENPKEFIFTYLVYKPMKMMKEPFYDMPIFDINKNIIKYMQQLIIIITGIGVLGWILRLKKVENKNGVLLLLLVNFYFIYLNAVYYAHPRYSAYIMPFIFLLTGYVVDIFYNLIKKYIIKLT